MFVFGILTMINFGLLAFSRIFFDNIILQGKEEKYIDKK